MRKPNEYELFRARAVLLTEIVAIDFYTQLALGTTGKSSFTIRYTYDA